MSWIEERKLIILGAFINIFFSLKLLKDTLRIKDFSYFYMMVLFVISIIIYWIYSCLLKNRKYRVLTNLALLFFLGLFILKNRAEFLQWIQNEFIENINHLYGLADKFQITEFNDYKTLFALTFVLIVPWIIALSYKFNNVIIFMNFTYITSMWFIGYNTEVKKNLQLYLFITLVSSAIFVYSKRIKKFLKDNVKIKLSPKKLIIYSCIFSIIIATISAELPQNFMGKYYTDYKGKLSNKFARKLEKSPLDIAKGGSYDLRNSGYSNNDKKLGGRIVLNDRVAFEIEGNYVKYIKGSMKDNYTGISWIQSPKIVFLKKEEGGQIFIPPEGLVDINKFKIGIKPKELKTTSLMVPSYACDVMEAKGRIYYDSTPVCISSEVQNESYSVKYMKGNFQTLDEFVKFRNNNDFVYTNYFLGNMVYSKEGKNEFEVDEDVEREVYSNGEFMMGPITAKDKYTNYLQVPNTVPERVFKLTKDIIKGSTSNEEKVKKIINYLNKNYKYYLDVFDVPEGKDFVDYFLFEEKKGYCTYFATSAAIMFRIAGVPSRYVEGFKVDRKAKINNHINVTNEEAHAWCEMLIDPEKDMWVIVDLSPTPVEYRKKNKQQSNVKINVENKKSNDNKNKKIDTQDLNDVEPRKNWSLSKKQVEIISIIAFIISIFILNLILHKVKRKKLIKGKSIIPLYCYTSKRFKSVGIIKGESIGDREFVESIEEKELRDNLFNMVDAYYKEHYGNIVDNEFDREKFLDFIEKYILSKDGKFKYYTKLFFHNFTIN